MRARPPVSTVTAFVLCTAAVAVACQPEPTVAPAPAPAPVDEGVVVPDDAYAVVGDVTIPRAAFDDALSKLSSGGPSSRDDRGLRQHVGLALVTRALVGLELKRLAIGDAAEVERRAQPLIAALEQDGKSATPTWWSAPPLGSDDLPGSVVVAAEGVAAAPEAELAAEYERQKDRWTSKKPWLRVDVWTLRYDDGVGVPECDAYIAKYRRCTTKFPASTQPTVLADLSRQATAWRHTAENAEAREVLRTECAAVEHEAMQQTASMGCDWESDATAAERKANAARRAERRGVAESARARLAAGEDPFAVAANTGGVASAGEMLAADELPKSVVSATKGLGVGKASKLVDDGHAWTIVRLVERHPAGTLPLEAVQRDVADDLRIRGLAEALEALPTTLRGKYEVVLHDSVESLDAGPTTK